MRKYLYSILLVFVLAAVPVSAAELPSVWAAAEVQTAIGLGLVPATLQSGYREPVTRGEFRSLTMQLPGMPDSLGQSSATKELLTRQQAAGMLYEACTEFAPWVINEDSIITTAWRGYASFEMPHSWTDGAGIRSDAREAVNWCYRHNVLNGTGGNTFAPEDALTREQAILAVLRLYYANGQAAQNPVQNRPDYYPIYTDQTMSSIRCWIDSSLKTYTEGEIGPLSPAEDPAETSGPARIARIGIGWYRLEASDGTALSKTYENALLYTGGNIYVGWIGENPRTYDVIRCDGTSQSTVVRTETFRFNNHVFDLGGGVYAVQNTDTRTSVFDVFGDTLSVITTADPVFLVGSANGLLYFQGQSEFGGIYYTQTGKALPPF